MAASGSLGTYSIDFIAKFAQFESDCGRAARIAEKTSQDMVASFNRIGEGLTEKLKDIASIIGVGFSLEGLKGLVEKLADVSSEALKTAEEMENLSTVLGVSTTTIQTVGLAATLVGGNLDTANTALTRLSRSAAEANAGNAKLLGDFQAIGISADQLGKLLQHPDDLIRVVTQHLSEFSNQGDKVAIVTQLMGRNAAQSIPMIQELGQHWNELNDQAQHFAGVTADDIAAMAAQQKELNRTGVEVKGLGLQLTNDLLPAIQNANAALRGLAESNTTRNSIKFIADIIDYVALHFDQFVADVASGGLAVAFGKAFASTQDGLNAINTLKIGWADMQRIGTIAWAGIKDAAETAAVSIEHFIAPIIAAFSNAALLQGNVALAKGLFDLSEQFKNATKSTGGFQQAVDDADAARDKYVAGLKVTIDVLPKIGKASEDAGGKVAHLPQQVKAAADDSGDALLKLQAIVDKLSGDAGGPYAKAIDDYNAALIRLQQAAQEAAIKGANVDEVIRLWQEGQAALTEKVLQTTDATRVLNTVMGAIDQTVARHVDLIGKTGTELAVEAEYQKLLNETLKAMDAVMGPLTEEEQARIERLHDTAAALVALDEQQKQSQALLRDWASQAASEFDSAFSTINKDIIEGGNVMKDLENIAKQVVEAILLQFEKLAIINPILNSIFGNATGSLLPTLSTAGGALGQLGGGGGVMGAIGSLFGFGGGALASSGAIAGGGSYVLADVGASAGAGILGTIGTVLPWIGVGIAAIGILDKLTGGNILGGSKQPWGSTQSIDISGSGASVSAAEQFKKKGALFSGNSYSWQNQPVDQQTQDAIAGFFASLQTAATQQAQAFGETVGAVVSGSWKETFDKNGKMVSSVSTVAGQQFSESMQQFEQRVLADTLLANMGSASKEAQAIAEQWQKSAADLLAGAQFLSQAQLDIANGHALVQNETLTDLTKFVTGMQAQGETLIQTYVRLSAETTDVQTILGNLGLDTKKTGEELVKFDDAMVKAAGGLDNLNTLWNDYYTKYYSTSEQAAIKLKNDQTAVQNLFAAIGQDPTESMATFRQNFEAIFSTLSPEDVVKWLQAGDALAAVNADLGTTAVKAQDFSKAISDGAASLSKLESDTQSLANGLFGTAIDQLKAQLAKYSGGGIEAFPFQQQLQKQIDAAQAQADSAKKLADASALLNNFAQIGAYTGQSLGQLSAQFSAPLDQLAQFLGTDAAGLQKQFDTAEKAALAGLQVADNTKLTNEILADILAQYQGKPEPYSEGDLNSAASGLNPAIASSKPGRGGIAPASAPDVVAAVHDGTEQNSDDMRANNALLERIAVALEGLRGNAGSAPPIGRRTIRGVVLTP